jgi:hypothetical protein
MKNNQTAAILVALLLLSTLCLGWFTHQYRRGLQKLQLYEVPANQAATAQNMLQSMAMDCMKYAETHKDLIPIIQANSAPAPAASARPASK